MDDLKNEDNIKNEEYLKKGDGFENWPSPPIFFAPLPSLWKITWNFSWWLLTVTATPQLMLNQKWYQASKPEMEFHMINIKHAALPMRAQREKTTFKCKDDRTHTALDIFWLAVFFCKYSVSLGDALSTAAVRPFLILLLSNMYRLIHYNPNVSIVLQVLNALSAVCLIMYL